MTPIATASQALLSQAARFEKNAGTIAAMGTKGGEESQAVPSSASDIVSAFVEQIELSHAFAAAIKVIKTADQMTGRLLDIKA